MFISMVIGIAVCSIMVYSCVTDERPTLAELNLLMDQGGRELRLIDRVAHKWRDLAVRLHFELFRIAAIGTDTRSVRDACCRMFAEWVDGREGLREPVTWATLIQVLRETGLSNMAEALKEIMS